MKVQKSDGEGIKKKNHNLISEIGGCSVDRYMLNNLHFS